MYSVFSMYQVEVPLVLGLSSLGVPGVPRNTQILADELTLFQPGGAGFNGLLRQRSIRRHGVIDVARYNSVTFYQILCPELC